MQGDMSCAMASHISEDKAFFKADAAAAFCI